jgi:hypothetical protein
MKESLERIKKLKKKLLKIDIKSLKEHLKLTSKRQIFDRKI